MGIPDKEVQAEMMFMLGIADPTNQVKVLSNMIELLSNEEMMKTLMVEQSKKAIVEKMNKVVSL